MLYTDDVSLQLVRRLLHVYALVLFVNMVDLGEAIDCFKCVSINGNDPTCDDPFHNNVTTKILESPCMGGRKGRDGLFPATACIKMAGTIADTGEVVTIRGCALDSGGLTTDTEIIRMSHCGAFYYDTRYVKGCLQSCDNADACNAATTRRSTVTLNIAASAAIVRFLVTACR